MCFGQVVIFDMENLLVMCHWSFGHGLTLSSHDRRGLRRSYNFLSLETDGKGSVLQLLRGLLVELVMRISWWKSRSAWGSKN